MRNFYFKSLCGLLIVFTFIGNTVVVNAQDVAYVSISKNSINNHSLEAVYNIDTKEVTASTVTLGSQVWMKTNLDISTYRNGDIIPQVQDPKEWSNLTTGAWCYYENKTENGNVYGKLYNWYAVHDSRGLAPEGWHVPSDEEWTALTDFFGGEKIAGQKMKLKNSKNPDNSDFSGLLGGTRNDYLGKYFGIRNSGIWWSSTAVYGGYAWYRGLYYDNAEVNRNYLNKTVGFSVRCVKD